MFGRFPWRVEVQIPSLESAVAQLVPQPPLNYFEPPSQTFIFEQTILFQKKILKSFEFEFCDVCSRKSSPCDSMVTISLSNPIMDILKEEVDQRQPKLLCPCSLRYFYVHRIHLENNNFTSYVRVCHECNLSLCNGDLPKFSIANKFYVEDVPNQLMGLSLAEELSISKVYKRSVVWQAGSKQHQALNHHILTFDNDVNNYTTILPRPTNEIRTLLKIIFLRDTDVEQVLPKVGVIEKAKIFEALAWLQQNNILYGDVVLNRSNLNLDRIVLDIEIHDSVNDLEKVIPQHATFHIAQESVQQQVSDGTIFQRTYSSGLYQVQSSIDDSRSFKVKGALNNWVKNASDGLMAQFHNNDILDIFGDLSWIVMSYPILFPTGCNGPHVKRKVEVCFEDWVKYFLTAKDPRFREHYDFSLFMFNIQQRRKVSRSYKLMLRSYPSNLITKQMLQEQLLRLKERRPLTNPDIIRLLQSTRHTGALVPFSPFRKMVLRSNILATIVEKGWPAFFITLNPNDLYSPIVKLQNQSEYKRNELLQIFSQMSNNNLVNSDWANFAGGGNGTDAVSCASYFHFMVSTFIEVFLGFNKETKEFTPSVFGTVCDFFGVIEEQQRKQLHIHMLVWVQDLTNYDKVHAALQNEEFKVRMLNYLDLIVSTSKNNTLLPVGNPSIWLCPELTATNIQDEYWKQFAWVQSWVQVHSCSRYHCMKKQKKCRYSFPKPLCSETIYNERTRKIDLKRNDQYLNAAFPPLSIVGRFNNDIRFIPGLDTPQIARYLAYYISNYTSKHEATNLHLVDFMAKKICDYERFKPDVLQKPADLFSGLLLKTLNKFSASNNVGSVTAASCLLGYSDHYCASTYTMINWKGWDIWVCKQLGSGYRLHSYTRLSNHSHYYRVLGFGLSNHQSEVSIQKDTALVSFFEEYIFRNSELKDLSIYELQAEYEISVQMIENITDDYYICSGFSVMNGSGLRVCHKKRPVRCIPSLPSFNSRSTVHGVGTEAFARLMLVLFKPFSSINDIWDPTFANFKLIFKQFLENLPPTSNAKRFIQNITKDAEVALEASNYTHPENPLDPNIFIQGSERGVVQWQNIRYHLSDPEEEGFVFPGDLPILSHKNPDMVQNMYLQQVDIDQQRALDRLNRPNLPGIDVIFRSREMWIQEINAYLELQRTPKTCSYQWACIKIFAKHFLETVTGSDPPPLRMLVHGEGGTGKSFVINTMVGLVKHFGQDDKICVSAPTGKAAVNVGGDTIDGLFGLSRSGNATGHGNTANTTEAPIYQSSPLNKATYLIVDEISMVGKERLADMHDKLGMNIGDGRTDHILGNKSFIFFGDFLQFPPVGKTCIISRSTFGFDENGVPTVFPQNRKGMLGTMIFNSIEYMIELIQQKRQDDPDYLELLRAIREQRVENHHVEYLKLKCLFEPFNSYSAEWLIQTPFVVTTNEEKAFWNTRLVQKYSEYHNRSIVKVKATDWIQRDCTASISNSHLNSIDLHNLQQKIIDNCVQYELCLVIGMSLVVLENLHKQLGVVNGAEVILRDIHYDIHHKPLALEVEVQTIQFQIPNLPANHIWIQKKKVSTTFTKLDGSTVTIQRIQFPVTEGFASTAHKKQGSTLSRAVVSLQKGQGVSTYVKLSRTKRAANTFILGDVTLKNLSIKPPTGWVQFRLVLTSKVQSTMNYVSTIHEIT